MDPGGGPALADFLFEDFGFLRTLRLGRAWAPVLFFTQTGVVSTATALKPNSVDANKKSMKEENLIPFSSE